MNKAILTLGFTVFIGNVQAAPIIDVTKIAGKTELEVSSQLGKPSSCSKSKYGNKCLYKTGQTEIVFINKKADWITVEDIDSIPFSKNALTILGLKVSNPSFKNSFSMRWESIQGLKEVSLFRGASTSDYAYIKVNTK